MGSVGSLSLHGCCLLPISECLMMDVSEDVSLFAFSSEAFNGLDHEQFWLKEHHVAIVLGP